MKQGLDILIRAARILYDGEQPSGEGRSIQIVIAGDGAMRIRLAEMIGRNALKNVFLLPLQPDQSYREMIADADCMVITQQQGAGSYFFPSKLLASLAAAKPVVTVADESSELARALAAGQFGINVPPNEPESLARAIRALSAAVAKAPCAPAHPEG